MKYLRHPHGKSGNSQEPVIIALCPPPSLPLFRYSNGKMSYRAEFVCQQLLYEFSVCEGKTGNRAVVVDGVNR